jgi:hypothetical protein
MLAIVLLSDMALFPDIMAHVKGKLPELTKIIPQKRIM